MSLKTHTKERFHLNYWLQAARFKFLPQGIMPVVIATALAFRTDVINPIFFFIALIAAACVQVGLTMFNDSLDFIYGTDKSRIDNKNPFSGGSGVLTGGFIQPKMVLLAVFILYLVAFVCALYLAYEVGLASLGIAVLGAFVSIFYSAKPLRFAYHGVGELMMFLGYGPIITSWAYFIHTGQLNQDVFFIGAIPGLLMWAMILINEIPDHAEDRAAGKRNITYHLGPRLTKNLFISSLLFIYFYIGVLLLIGVLPVTAALAYVGIPLALKAALVSHNHFKDPIRVAESNKYMVLVYSVTTVAVAIGLLV